MTIKEAHANCYSKVDIDELAKYLDGIKNEAIKEFAEYLKNYLSNRNAVSASFVSGLIDEYVKQKTIE